MLFDPKWMPPEAPVQIPSKKKKAKSKRKTWRSLMLKAAAILEKDGWTTGQLYRPGVGFCAIGALSRADGAYKRDLHENSDSAYLGSKTFVIAQDKLGEYLNERWLFGVDIAGWNDEVARSAEVVIRTLREVANK